jgi:hypothetical protein
MKRNQQTLNIGVLTGIKVRTRVRLATITELVRDGKVLAKGVATIHPGEEETMDFSVGRKLSQDRAVEDFFNQARGIAKARTHDPKDRITRLLLQDQINQDERQAKLSLSAQRSLLGKRKAKLSHPSQSYAPR